MKRTFTTIAFSLIRVLALVGIILTTANLNHLQAQLTGVKNIPGDYADLATAIADLNTQGVGAGGVTLNLVAGNPQTAPAGGYSITTLTGTMANQITLEGNGNTITANASLTVGAINDAIFKIIGADYVTINAFSMQENAANTINTPAGSNNMTEWGVALLYSSATEGAQNNTISNNTITLVRTYLNTFGVYSNTRHTSTAPSTTADITAATGANKSNKVYGNTISNVNMGITFIGSNNAAFQDSGNDLGGSSASTGNTISNWGGAGALSSYVSNSGTSYCIFMNHQTAFNVSYNTLTSASVTPATTFRGIVQDYTATAPTGTFTNTISNNTVTMTSAATSGTFTVINTVSGNNMMTVNITNNTILNCAISGVASSSTMTCILNSGAINTLNINNNIIRGNTSTATTGGFTGASNTGSVTTTINMNNNQVGNASGNAITFSAANSGAVLGINCSGGASTCTTTIQSNDVRGITHTVAGSSAHSYIVSTGTPLSNTVVSNTFTNLNVNTTGAVLFINHGYTIPSTGQMIINNNSIVTAYNRTGASGSVTLTTTNSTSGTGSVNNYTNNNFSNITVAGTTSLTGFNNTDGGTGSTKTITGNTFNNWTAITGAINTMNFTYWNGVSSLSNNTITNITGQSQVTGITMGSAANNATSIAVNSNTLTNLSSTAFGTVIGITCSNTSTLINISENTISTLSATGSASVYGINLSGATTTNIFKNKIYDLSGSNAASGVSGIRVAGGSTINVYNNLIGDLRTPAANSTLPLIGLNIQGGSVVNAYYNTVYLNASSTGATFGSSAVFVSTTPTVTLRNNIFVNTSTPAGAIGFTLAYMRSSTTLTSYGSTSNNNLFYAGTPGANNLIFYDGTNSDQTLAAFKTRVTPRDASSVTENPTFISTTGANANFLHINTSIATQVESGAANLASITDDYDAVTRQGNAGYGGTGTSPDIGADEGEFVLLDLTGPGITYTPLVGYCGTGDATLQGVTITDATGVPTMGTLRPRIYYKKGAGAYFSQPGTLASGTGQNGTWNFPIVAADMGGLMSGDVVSYFVIAQDQVGTPNISSNPTGAVATDVNNVTTPPASPNTATVVTSLSGTYTVGVGGNYTTLKAAVDDYNTKCLAGPVVFSLTDATYPSEVFPITINQVAGASSVNTLTIKPAVGVTPSISGSSSSALIVLNGADFIVIDGSNGNTANTICPLSTASRDLTLTNTNAGGGFYAVVWLQTTGSNGTTDNKVINCNLIGSGNTQTIFGVGMGSNSISITSLGTGNNNNSFINNNVSKVLYALYSQGASGTNKNTGNIFNQNLVNTASPNNVRRAGIFVGFENNVTISGNNISGIESATTIEDVFGITFGANAISTSTFPGNEVTNAVVSNNIIGSIRHTNTYSACGIFVAPATSGTNRISNNTISGVSANGTSGDFSVGILLGGGAGSTTQVYYNTISMSGTQSGGSDKSYCLAIGGSNPTVDVRNNIFVNTQNNGTGNNYAIGYGYSTFTALTSDNNDFYVSSGATFFIGATASISAPTNQATLANLQGATGKDAASINVNPVFTTATDLHLVAADPINAPLLCGGKPVTPVTTDIDCATRSNVTPTIGADEIPLNFSPSITITETSGTADDGIICSGSTVTLTAFPATGVTYAWSTLATTSSIMVSPTANTTYTVTVTNGSCSSASSVTVTVNPALVLTEMHVNVLCDGASTGSIDLSVSGGLSPFTYSWTGGATTQDRSGLAAGTYTVTVTDANTCSMTLSVTITQPATLALTETHIDVACNGGSTGSIDLTVTGGTGAYTYSWTGGATTQDRSGLAGGTYTVTVTDANACTKTLSVTIIEPAVLALTETHVNVLCNGASTGSIDLTVTGGTGAYTYSWTGAATTQDRSGLAAGTYTVTVTDANACTQTLSVSITESAAIVLTETHVNVLCNGGSTGSIDLTVSGGTGAYTYSWTGGATTQDRSGLAAGTYTVTVTDANACTKTLSVAITEPTTIGLTETHVNVLCNGGSTGSIDLTVSGGTGAYTYSWTGGATTQDRSGLVAGTYTVTVTDANACTKTLSVAITEPAAIVLTETHVNVLCNGASTGSIDLTVSGGTGAYTYSWTGGATTQDRSGLAAGTYTVTVTDANACTKTLSIAITEPTAIVLTETHVNVLCNGASTGSIDLTVSGGTGAYTYSWTGGATTQDRSGLAAGTYTVTVTDANACTKTLSITITEPSAIVLTETHVNVLCNGGSTGSIDLTVSGGTGAYTYSWTGGATTQDRSGLAAGTYTVTVTDANACTKTLSVAIIEPTAIVLTETHVNVLCNGGSTGSIDLTVSGGTGAYTYSWTGGATTQDRSGLAAGTYTVTVTDANACTKTLSIAITEPPAIGLTETHADATCGNANGTIDLTVSGGTGAYTYAWTGGATTQDRSALTAGTYTVTVTDANACTKTLSVAIANLGGPSLSETHVNSTCGSSNGSIDLTVSGGSSPYTYAWSNLANTEDLTNLAGGVYIVTVTDANACTNTLSVTILNNGGPILSETHVNVTCNGGSNGSIDLSVTGGVSPYTYSWTGGVTTQDRSGLTAGTYTVTVTDANACSAVLSINVTEPAALVLTETHVNVLCNGGSTGSIDLTVTGGTTPYTYSWTGGATTQDRSGLAVGTYTVTVTDANACTKTLSVTITEPTTIVLTETHVNVLCNGASTGSIDLTVTGGTGAYTYSWTGGVTTQDRSGLAAGTYTVTVTDANACTKTLSVTITEPTAIVLTETHVNVLCNGSSTGSIDLTVTGGTGAYTYSWTGGATTQDRSGLSAGTYTVTVTDANACTKTLSVTITEPSPLVLTETHVNVLCNGGSSGSIDLTVTGGTGAYTYSWTGGATTQDRSGLVAGTYTVTVTDANACTKTLSIAITEPTVLVLTETHVNVLCNGASTGSIDLTVTGGTGAYTYSWTGGATTQDRSGLAAGTYTVTVTDANACTKTLSTTITEPTAIVLTETHVNVLCNGASTGSIDLTVTGGTGAYTYSWTGGATTQDRSGLAAGTYTVTVTDANACTKTLSTTITEPAALSLTETHVNVACNGGSTGSIDLTVSGGTGAYTYSWTGGVTTQDRSGLVAGSYTVTVTDANACTKTLSVTITEASTLVLTETHVNVLCNGGSTGSIDLTVTGGTGSYTYSWTGGATTQDRSSLVAGTYTVTVTDANACTKTLSATITEASAIVLTETHVNVLCNGAATGSIDLTVTGGTGAYTYSWTGGATTQDRSGLVAGTYTVTVTDASACTKTLSVAITQPTAIVLTETHVNILCNGGSNGSIDLTVTGGTGAYTYSWTGGVTTQDIINLIVGTYTVTVTDANACTKTLSVAITEPATLSLTETHVNVLCTGNSTGSIDLTVTGGMAAYTYSWTGGVTTQDRSGLAIGTYTVTVTDANACTKTLSVTITEPTAIVLSTTVTPACAGVNNGTIDLTVSGGTGAYTYFWTGGATTQDLANLGAGTYTVTVTDANACTKTISATIVQSPLINLSTTSTNTCTGTSVGTIDLTVTGGTPGFTYIWTPGGATTQDISNLAAGTYTVTVTDANTCTKTISQTVVANPVPTVNAVANQTLCAGSTTAAVTFGGTPAGVVFNWTNNNISIGLAANGTGNIASFVAVNNTLVPVVATITVTPQITAGGTTCLGTPITFTITVNPLPAQFTITGGGLVCTTDNIGVPVGLSGSQSGVNYQLFLNGNPVGAPVAGTGNAISFGTQLPAGTYTVVATATLGGCTRTMTGSVSVATFNCTVAISDPCVCLNNASTLFDGQFGEQIKVNAPSTQTWKVTAINGLYSTGSPAPPGAPIPLAVGTTLLNIGGNMFTLDGRHVDAIGYTLTVSNSLGTFLSIGNSCQYPNPTITADLGHDFCLFSNPVDLTGDPGDANIVSQGFTVDGVAATQFDAGSAGIGQHLIVYTVNGGVPKAFGPNDPGCIQSVSIFVNVIVTPSNLICNDLVYLSLDADCTADILPDDILEGSYGCYDDYLVELDKTVPYGNGPWVPGTVNTADIGKTYQVRITHLVSDNKCWGNVKVEDKLPPALVCENFTIPCNTPNLSPAYLQNVLGLAFAFPAYTDCQAVTLTWSDTEVDKDCASGLSKVITRKWTAVDASGNSSTCIQTIGLLRPGVDDLKLPPSYDGFQEPGFNCTSAYPTPDWIESQGLQGYPYVFGRPEGCNINWAYTDVLIEVCDGTYKVVREWTLLNWCTGQVIHYDQVIKVADNEGPQFTCPANLTVSTDPFACCATVNLPDVIVTDNCSRINKIGGMIVVRDPYTGNQINMVTIGGALTDFAGNNHWTSDTLAAYGNTSCLPMGAHTVTYIIEDDCGNKSSCNFGLTVGDYTPPVAACDETTTVAIGVDDQFDCYTPADGCDFAGVTWVKASTFNDGSYDNCNNVKLTVRRMEPYSDCINQLNDDPCYENEDGDLVFGEQDIAKMELDSIKFYCCEVGTTQTIILRVYQTDINGNIMSAPDGNPIYNDCMVQVEVQDKLKPSCLPPAQVAVNCENFDPSLWAYGKPQVADNCCLDTSKVYQGQCGLTHTASYTLFDTVCNKGTITRTFRAFDCHGQSSQCTQRVIVTYEQDYFVKFPNDVIVTVCDGTGNYGEPTFFGEDCELLGVSFEDEVFTVVPDACFKIERSWTIINWCTYNPNLPCINVPNPNPNPIANASANLAGPTVSECGTLAPWAPTVVKINPTDPQTTNFCTFWDKECQLLQVQADHQDHRRTGANGYLRCAGLFQRQLVHTEQFPTVE